MGCTMFDRRFKISAHAHAQVLEIIAPGDLGQKFKMLVGASLIGGMHMRPEICKPIFVSALRNKTIGTAHAHSRLLLFITGIDLNEELQLPRLLCHFCGNRLGNAWPVYRVNGIKQADRVRCLVALQGANQMQFQPRCG